VATIRVPADQPTLQAAANAANDGDTIVLAAGTYSASGQPQLLDLRASVTGTVFSSLGIMAEVDYAAVLDFGGLTARGVRCGGADAAGVTFQGFVLTGTPAAGPIWDTSDGTLTGWLWSGLRAQTMAVVPFAFTTADLLSCEFGDIELLASIVASAGFDIRGQGAADLDTLLRSIQIAGAGLGTGIYLRDVRDMRLRDIQMDSPGGYGLRLDGRTVGRGIRSVAVRDLTVNNPAGVGIHIGDLDSGQAYGSLVECSDVRLFGVQVLTATGEAIVLERGVQDCHLSGGKVTGGTASLVMRDEVVGCSAKFLETVAPSARHVHLRNAQDCVVEQCTLVGAAVGFTDEDDVAPTLRSARNSFRFNVLAQCTRAYDLQDGFGGVGEEHVLGPNLVVTPTTEWARVSGTGYSKAAFEALSTQAAGDTEAASAGFEDEAGGDYRLRSDSLAVGVGDPGLAVMQYQSAGAFPRELYSRFWPLFPSDAETAEGRLPEILDYIVARVKALLGHDRVFNRLRIIRSETVLRAATIGPRGIHFWEGRRATTNEAHAANRAARRVHVLQIVGRIVANDALANESELQAEAERIADALRPDVKLGNLVELSRVESCAVTDVEYAGAACCQATISLRVQEFLSW